MIKVALFKKMSCLRMSSQQQHKRLLKGYGQNNISDKRVLLFLFPFGLNTIGKLIINKVYFSCQKKSDQQQNS